VGWTNNYPGNTDTRYYWKLTRHIFRYSHGHAEDVREVHTVDERIRATAFAKMIKFYSTLILNGEPDRVLPPFTVLKCVYLYS
jgi:Gly-Xaa carboxypeptidase